VVPETLEPSMQLAAAVLGTMEIPSDDISIALERFRTSHVAELKNLTLVDGATA
jgi:hypothetical protein